jgi:hypothetical protein
MSKLEMSKLKTVLQDETVRLAQTDSVSWDAVIRAARISSPEIFEALGRRLADSAVRKILSQQATRKPQTPASQGIFAGYVGLHQFIPVLVSRDGKPKIEWKLLEKATLREIGAWLAEEHKSALTRRQRNPGTAKLLRDLSKVPNSLDMTVEQAAAKLAAAGKKKRA